MRVCRIAECLVLLSDDHPTCAGPWCLDVRGHVVQKQGHRIKVQRLYVVFVHMLMVLVGEPTIVQP